MLESELKKNTEALLANTAAILASQGGANAASSTPTAQPAGQVAATPTPVVAQPVVAQPAIPAVAPQAQAPAIAAPVAAPVVAPVVAAAPGASQLTHVQAQAELTAIVQALGDGAQVQATMLQYGSARLNEIPVENLFSMVQACKALRKA